LADSIYIEEEKALKDFLLDIECLDRLSEWTSKFNIFNILKISQTEIRHSNVLSWLLNPNENHGFNDSVLRGFIQYVVNAFGESIDVFDILLMDYHDFTILREWKNIDILALSEEEKFILCIENKIFSGEHSNQLARYRAIVEDTFPEYKKKYIFLSPDGLESSEPDFWCSMGYQDVLDIIESAHKKVELLPDSELLIKNYIETIRRDILGDEKLTQICIDIYKKHQKALDLIFENKPDRASEAADIFRQWATEMAAKGEIFFNIDDCSKKFTRFKTANMSELLPDADEARSGWKTKNHYFYEIVYDGDHDQYFIQLSFSGKNIPEDLKNMCERINVYYPCKQQKANWQWRTHYKTKQYKIDNEHSEEKIYNRLNEKLIEIKEFEKQLKDKLDQEAI